MNPAFFQQLETVLASERIDAYRQDSAPPALTLARYLWNISLCEALYSPLQIAEVALRNSVHRSMQARLFVEAWYDLPAARLLSWQQSQVAEAHQKLATSGKPDSAGRMVAEMHFGFWTGFFNKAHAGTGIGHFLAQQAFPLAPKAERDLKKLDARWRRIRDLRNRIFHHERIIHFADLAAQHAAVLEIIGWISPELLEMTRSIDRFPAVYQAGVQPWLDQIAARWPRQP